MFVHFDQLNLINIKDRNKFISRWKSEQGSEILNFIIKEFEKGVDKYFLQTEQDANTIETIMTGNRDFKGIELSNMKFDNSGRSFFKYFNFSYANLSVIEFQNCDFWEPYFFNTQFWKCKFINCTFSFAHFYACTFNDCLFEDVSFCQYDDIFNSDFKNTNFSNFFISQPLFKDCQFNSSVNLTDISRKPVGTSKMKISYDVKSYADHYRSISEAFESGKVTEKRIEFLYKSKQAFYKYNTKGMKKINGFIIKSLTGFGLKPIRPVLMSLIILIIFSFLFLLNKNNFFDAFLLSSSSFLTLGDVSSLCFPFNLLGIIEAFFGIISTGLFLGTLLNIWFMER